MDGDVEGDPVVSVEGEDVFEGEGDNRDGDEEEIYGLEFTFEGEVEGDEEPEGDVRDVDDAPRGVMCIPELDRSE